MASVLELSENDFESKVLNETKPVLLDFWSPTCGPCRLLAPIVEALAAANTDKAVIMKCNTAENMNLALQLNITAVPTILLFKNGQVVSRLVGVQKPQKLQELIDSNL